MEKEKNTKNVQEEVKPVPVLKFSKESILKSKKYSNRKDLLGVILESQKEYSFDEVDRMIEKFMKGKVN